MEKKNRQITGMVIGALTGAAIGFVLVKLLLDSRSADKGEKLLSAGCAFISVVFFYLLGVIIHEAGHLVMGLMTGYKFVSFRIGSFIIVKRNGKLKLDRFTLPGTAGQCLMTHDMVDDPENIPYFWYHAGGGLFNLLTAVICGCVFLIFGSGMVSALFFIAMMISLFMALLNLIPMKISGVSNDGLHILSQYRSVEERAKMLNTLIINGRSYQGEMLDEMPDKLFEGGDPSGDIGKVQIAIYCASRYCERFDFTAAKEIYESVLSNENITKILISECKCELMFCRIMTGEPADKIDELYDDELQKYIKQTEKYILSRPILMYAYYYIYKKDENLSDKYYNLSMAMAKDYFCPGEARYGMAMIEHIKENYR